ncbi:MAG: hypothetical protein LAT64_09810 [Phycisphaerales bacterium]|nr:hypothetical protein [Planctomycetota bacterium]MCH8509044.1 hypothetical protein [Phycisphaerales bacterium]
MQSNKPESTSKAPQQGAHATDKRDQQENPQGRDAKAQNQGNQPGQQAGERHANDKNAQNPQGASQGKTDGSSQPAKK